jgi:uncharacterized protein with HEPN domain
MAKHEHAIILRQMRDHGREALSLVKGKTRGDLEADRLLNLSTIRLLEILGEAANRVPAEIRANYPDIPWQQLIGLRNRLIHAYNHVDLDIIWQILTKDLPGLVDRLEKIVGGD